jgi:16S rRNA (guanine1207-N2)-methyltransferase
MTHYFDPKPDVASAVRSVPLVLPDLTLDLFTDRGVFSADHVDDGTKLLLQETPPPPAEGTLLDLGCGYGAIAVTVARRAPNATVWAVDINARARELTRRNADALGTANITVAAPGDVPPKLAFDLLYSNPPIRIGKAALHELLTAWLPRAATSYLVVHKHLGSDSLARWMQEQGWQVERRTSRVGYRILQVVP